MTIKLNDSLEYRLFPIPFMVLTLCGSWYPEQWSKNLKIIYKVFMFSILFLGILLFIEVFIKVIEAEDMSQIDLEVLFTEIVFAVGIYKKINMMYYRQRILNFISKYTENQWFKPKNPAEESIRANIMFETRWVTIIYTTFIVVSIILRAVTPMIGSKTLIILLLDASYPYKLDNFLAFWFTYFHQVIAGVTLTCMHVCTDTLFVGLLLQMKCQLQILKHRLREFGTLKSKTCKLASKINGEKLNDVISQRVREHESIFRFGRDLQKTFKPILIGQIIVVIPSVIINVYFLSVYTDRINLKYFTTFFFALVSLMQIYMFCWYGNEIVLNSSDVGDALYECNWTNLSQSTKKIILTVITRSSKTLVISAVAAIPLDINSFIMIMKTSYSAFNLLQQTATQ